MSATSCPLCCPPVASPSQELTNLLYVHIYISIPTILVNPILIINNTRTHINISHGDVLLAYEMNDKPIPVQHGAPVRVIVPGHVGVRNVKWLHHIALSHEESHGPWQRGMSYKGFGPSVKSLDGINVEAVQSLQEQPVTSAITVPAEGSDVPVGCKTTVSGFSYSGGGRGIVRVDVSMDGGATWQTADLKEGSEQRVRMYAGRVRIANYYILYPV
jgi:DMSO/TMAO reductase YedYZ molybdopterin-dependent catalytic subunit